MTLPRISVQQARNLQLAAQGLLARPRRRARKADVLAALLRMRVLQIDTIHVVARSPYLVLFSRLGSYDPSWLDDLLTEGAVFECWAHEACFAPMADHGLHAAHRGGRAAHWAMRHAARVLREDAAELDALLERIRAHGEVRAADFVRPPGMSGSAWWGWKDEKRWLEALFARGDLMVARRENFHRVYDLAERVLARGHVVAAGGAPIEEDYSRAAVRALGIVQARWINDYFRYGPRLRDEDLVESVGSGELLQVEVAGWTAPGYVHRDHAGLLDAAIGGRLRATHTTLLSPFDPLVWDRQRAALMFGFDYRLECYTPAAKRRHGYFVLPILHRGRLVGRLDAKAHRSEGVFEVKALFLQDGVAPTTALAVGLRDAIRRAAAWHGTPQVEIGPCEPRGLRAALLRHL
ncbi:winged helix-turn-helix domain-containing protein [Dokdonella sp.]|uniref:winged helix-turn-helix domain-containing protein n=1 Tax=Dokdonella sp. TaxID=2291710 RepID=UPI0031C39D91|nr:winged helix DNA-binding domain-containing protein [Dokdonella sp.]